MGLRERVKQIKGAVGRATAKEIAKGVAKAIRSLIREYGREGLVEAADRDFDILEKTSQYYPKLYKFGSRINTSEFGVDENFFKYHVYRILKEEGVRGLPKEVIDWINGEIHKVFSFLKG